MFALGVLFFLTWLRVHVKIIGGTSVGGIVGAAFAMDDILEAAKVFTEDLPQTRGFFDLQRWKKTGRPGDLDAIIATCIDRFELSKLDRSPIKAFTGTYDKPNKQVIYGELTAENAVEALRRSAANIVLSPLLPDENGKPRFTDAGLVEYLPIHLVEEDGPWPAEKVIVIDYNCPETKIPGWLARLGGHVLGDTYVGLATNIPTGYQEAMRTIKADPDRYYVISPLNAPLGFNPIAQKPKTLAKIFRAGLDAAKHHEPGIKAWLGVE